MQRGWKSLETPLAEGLRIQYNFVTAHQALSGQTPAQAASIQIVAKDKSVDSLELALLRTNQNQGDGL